MRRPLFAAAIAALLALPASRETGAQVQAQTQEPPLNIAADNVTGSHGPEGDEVMLNGNLRVTRGRSLLTADRGRYLRQQGRLFLSGHVKLVDSTTTVTCKEAEYSELEDLLMVSGDVEMTDRDARLRAPRGRYDRKRGIVELMDGVEGRDKQQRLLADQATYVRDSMVVHARGHGRGFDEENKLELEAEAIDYDRRSHIAVATGSPLMRSREGEGGRVTIVRAQKLRLDTETRVAEAIDSVTVERDTLRGRADFGRFDDREQRGWLYGSPRVWDDQTTMSGDTLQLYSVERRLRRVEVLGNAAIDYRGNRPNTIGESSRLTGQRGDIWFTHDEIDSLVAVGDAQNDYQAPPHPGKTPETNTAKGDTITAFFKQRKIDRARVQGNARGQYHLGVNVGDTTAVKREIVDYQARQITFLVPQNRIVLSGSAQLGYGDLSLHARRVEYDVEGETMVAEGNPELIEKSDRVTGHLMTYDMNSRVGTIYEAETAYERGLYHGDKIRRVAENELDVMHGAYSTCDLPQPHYHFTAKYMKIYLKDKLVAKPVVFYVRNVPLLALPFWIFPIKPGRHSGLMFPQIEFGYSSASGQYIRNAGYYWAPNDYYDLTFTGDYYQAEPSWVLSAEGFYKLLYVLDGDFKSTYAKNERTGSEDWDARFHHNQEVNPATRISAQGAFISSRSYSVSNLYGRTLAQRLDRFLTSSFAVTHNVPWLSLTMAVDRQEDLDADESLKDPDGAGPLQGPAAGTTASLANLTQNLPNLSMSFPTRTLGSLPFLRGTGFEKALASTYFSLGARYQAWYERRGYVAGYDSLTSSTTIGQRVTTRYGFQSGSSLSDARRVGFLNIAPHFDVNAVMFDFDELGNKVVPAATWSTGITSSASFYGTFRPRIGALDGLRHVVTPTVSYAYAPGFPSLNYVDSLGVEQPRFHGFGSIGISGFEQSFLSFGLDQRLQVKLRRGDQVTRLDNLVLLSTRGTVNFLYKDFHQPHALSPLGWSLLISPPGLMNASFGWTTDFYQAHALRNLGYNIGLNLSNNLLKRRSTTPDLPLGDVRPQSQEPENQEFRQDWSLGLAYSYAGGYDARELWSTTRTLNAVARLGLTENWSFDYSMSADINRMEVGTQRFGLTRILHCWFATFSRTFIQGGETEYFFRLGVRDQRELYYERGTRTGSIGGIQ